MRRGGQQWGRALVVAACCWTAEAHAQAVPPATAPTTPSQADSVKTAPATFVVDTTRRVTVVTAEPSDAVTRPLAVRIGAAIVVITLTTLLLYNVRSR
jgi:Rieske Fe-S protein